MVAKLSEEGKVSLRNIRRDALKTIEHQEKEGLLSKDEKRSLDAAIKKLMSRHESDLDKRTKAKQGELSSV